jgi:hypothetical protein
MRSRHSSHRLWKMFNRCVVCGEKLIFVPSRKKDARAPEGVMYCEKNHDRFLVEGGYDVAGGWHTSFVMPPLGKRWQLETV